MPNNGNYGYDGPAWRAISTASPIPGDVVMYGSGGGAHVTSYVNNGVLMDVERAEAHAIKIPELRSAEPPVELLERLDPDYVGTFELVRIVGGEFLDYAIEFTTPRGRMRVHRDVHETWEECLIRVGLLDGP